MPALPWSHRQVIDPDHVYVVMASRLPLKAHRFIPGFLVDTLRIRRQLARTEGLVAYALNAQLARKTFWTYSVWIDQGSLDTFPAPIPIDGSSSDFEAGWTSRASSSCACAGGDSSDWSAMQDPVR